MGCSKAKPEEPLISSKAKPEEPLISSGGVGVSNVGPANEGVFDIEDVGPTKFKIHYPGDIPKTKITPDQDQRHQEPIDAAGKIHVVWNLNDTAVEAYFHKQRLESPDIQPVEDADTGSHAIPIAPMADEQHATVIQREALVGPDGAHENCGAWEEISKTFTAYHILKSIASPDSAVHKLKFMYTDGCLVEYYSVRNNQWLPATVKVTVEQMKGDNSDVDLVVMYDITILGTRLQEQRNVEVNRLRLPLQGGDLVEVFSVRQGGTWLSANIHRCQNPGATLAGYRVALAGKYILSDPVPAVRLRRRFPRNSPISVYEGCEKGWCHAVVEYTMDGSSKDDLWTKIFVKINDSGECKAIPSFLIRQRRP